MRIVKSVFTTPLFFVFTVYMKEKIKENNKEEKHTKKADRQKKLLERLGFMQMMFDFYTAPIT